MVFNSTERRGLYSCGSEKSTTVVGFCEYGNELTSCIKRRQFLEQARNHYLLKDSAHIRLRQREDFTIAYALECVMQELQFY